MAIFMRVLIALVLVAVAMFCVFGFLATFEPPGFRVWRIIYGTVVLACVIGVAWIFMQPGKP